MTLISLFADLVVPYDFLVSLSELYLLDPHTRQILQRKSQNLQSIISKILIKTHQSLLDDRIERNGIC